MSSKRMQLRGDLYQEGGWWKLRWRQHTPDGEYKWCKPVKVGYCAGPQAITKTEARRIAKRDHLDKLDINLALMPRSLWTLEQFVRTRFVPDRVQLRKPNTQTFYNTTLRFIVEGVPPAKLKSKGVKGTVDTVRTGGLGQMPLNTVEHQHIQTLLNLMRDRGYSVKVLRHCRAVVRTLFDYAEVAGFWAGVNPAKHTVLPEPRPARVRHALTLPQVVRLLGCLNSPVREMALTAVLTGMGIAELAGLRWGRVNLTPDPIIIDGGVELPPMSLYVCEQYFSEHGFGSVKGAKRNRCIPVTPLLANAFKKLGPAESLSSPVFLSREGNPLNASNARRSLQTGGAKASVPWVGWHDLRRTFATLTDSAGLTPSQRQVLMGHAHVRMTGHYTLQQTESARPQLEAIALRLLTD